LVGCSIGRSPEVARARSSDAGDITSKPMLIGYARVSTVNQNLALQRDALTKAGCAKIFTEQMSGAATDRPALRDALEFARSGDTLIVWKLDRLARSMKQLIETVETLRLAEFERSLIRERTRAAARRAARWPHGRPTAETHRRRHRGRQGDAPQSRHRFNSIAQRLGVSPATLYRYIPAARTANTPYTADCRSRRRLLEPPAWNGPTIARHSAEQR
jgi:DNA invertase Pin-like site-specific DNA recombinase